MVCKDNYRRQTNTVTYPVTQLQLSVQQLDEVGIQLHQYQGFVSQTYYSAFVPATLAVDLQAHLAWVVDQLREEQRIQSNQIPDIYLAGNEDLFEQLNRAIGREVDFEAGFYRIGGSRPGIYMRTDFFRTEIQRILTHEYVHLVLGEVAGSKAIPAWLNEGLAGYYEFQLGVRSERPDVSRRQLYISVDRAKQAVNSGTLIQLTSLESQAVWNAQTNQDLINLQYAEAHMAVRFLIESYGIRIPVDMVRGIADGSSLAMAVKSVTDLSSGEFEQAFVSWLSTWEDPQRDSTRKYIDAANEIMTSQDVILDRRAADLESQAPFVQRVHEKQALVSDTEGLESTAQALSPPDHLVKLHQNLLEYLSRLSAWLTLELEWVQTRNDSKRVQANDMILEIDARSSTVLREINSIEFTYQLNE